MSYLRSDRIDELSDRLELRGSFRVRQGATALITGLAADADRIYAIDFEAGELLVIDYATGNVVQSFGWLPGLRRIEVYGSPHIRWAKARVERSGARLSI